MKTKSYYLSAIYDGGSFLLDRVPYDSLESAVKAYDFECNERIKKKQNYIRYNYIRTEMEYTYGDNIISINEARRMIKISQL